MLEKRRLRLVPLVAALATAVAAPLTPAWAADPAPAATPAPPPTVEAQSSSTWRSYAFPSALVASGLGLATGVAFHLRADQRTADFNGLMGTEGRPCTENTVGRGGPACAALYDDINTAQRWRNIGFGVAGAFAVTALVLKLTEPDKEPNATRTASNRLACAPGFGLSATCAVTF